MPVRPSCLCKRASHVQKSGHSYPKGDDSLAIFWRRRTHIPSGSSLANANETTRTSDTVERQPPSVPPVQTPVETNPFVGKRFGDLIDDIVVEHARTGGFENLQGKGKPMDLPDAIHEDYVLHKTMKNANVLPPWLELQHEIKDAIADLVKRLDRGKLEDLDERIAAINSKISKYNQQCPSPLLQKPTLGRDNLHHQYEQWK